MNVNLITPKGKIVIHDLPRLFKELKFVISSADYLGLKVDIRVTAGSQRLTPITIPDVGEISEVHEKRAPRASRKLAPQNKPKLNKKWLARAAKKPGFRAWGYAKKHNVAYSTVYRALRQITDAQ